MNLTHDNKAADIDKISQNASEIGRSWSPCCFLCIPQVLKRDTGKGDRFKADLSRRERGPDSELDNGKSSLLCFPRKKSSYGGKLIFFSPLWEMSFSTRPWQFSNDGRLDTISVTHEKRDSDRFFFSSWRICQRQYECMIAAAAERPIWHSVCITARLPWNCPEVAMWWPLAKTQTRWLKGNTSKSDSVNLLLWHACTERAPDYP